MEKFEEGSNGSKKEKMEFGARGSEETPMLGTYVGSKHDTEMQIKRAARTWMQIKKRFKKCKCSQKNSTSMYADDTSLCFKSKGSSQLNEALSEDFSRLDARLISNKLTHNVAKTQSMLVSTKAKRKALDNFNQNYK